ncbi:MAG: fibronectin type III domain-containing protein [Treponema sp.]|nr:fibronectin type III domain-containing protein [Treponema sp.]
MRKKNFSIFGIAGIFLLVGAFMFTACPNDGGTTPTPPPAEYFLDEAVVGSTGGSITRTSPTTGKVAVGTTVTVNVTANTNFAITWVRVYAETEVGNGSTFLATTAGTGGDYTFEMPAYDAEVRVLFTSTLLPQFTTAPSISNALAANLSITFDLVASVPAATSYMLYYNVGNVDATALIANGYSQAATVGANTIGSLTNDLEYSFVVVATLATHSGNDASGVLQRTPAAAVQNFITAPAISAITTANQSITFTLGASNPVASSYAVFYAAGASVPEATLLTGTPQTVTVGSNTISGLTNDQAYSFVVQATLTGYTGNRTSAVANAIPAIPVQPFTTAPVINTVVNGDTSITFNLVASAPAASSYALYYAAGAAVPEATLLAGTPQTVTVGSNTISGLTNNTTYSFVVRATLANYAGNDVSAVATGTPVAAGPGVQPFTTAPILTVAPAHNSLTYTITDSVPAASSYTIYYIQNAAGSQTVHPVDIIIDNGNTQPTTAVTGTITGLTNGRLINLVVVATLANYLGNDTSDPITGTPASPPFTTMPNLTAATAGNGTIAVTWAASSPAATSYTVHWAVGADLTPAQIKAAATNAPAVSPYTITGLTNGTTYSVVVTATAVGYANGDSNVMSATPFQPAAVEYNITILPTVNGTGTVTAATENGNPTSSPSNEMVYLDITPPAGMEPVIVRVMRVTPSTQLRVYDLIDAATSLIGRPNFTMPAGDVTVEVTFGPIATYRVLIDGAPNTDAQPQGVLEAGTMFGENINFPVSAQQEGLSGNTCLIFNYENDWGALIMGGSLGAFPYLTPLGGATALSFWIRGDINGNLNAVGFGSGNHSISYTGQTGGGIPFTTTWQNVLIPVPNGAMELGTLLSILPAAASAGFNIYIDRVEYVITSQTVTSVATNPMPALAAPPATTPITNMLPMNIGYTVGGQTRNLTNVSLAWHPTAPLTVTGAATAAGQVITPTVAGGTFNLQVTIGGVTSASTPYQIAAGAFVILEPFTPNSVPGYFNPWTTGMSDEDWTAAFQAAYEVPTDLPNYIGASNPPPFGDKSGAWSFWSAGQAAAPRPNIFSFQANGGEGWAANNTWAGVRGHNWDVSQYTTLTFDARMMREQPAPSTAPTTGAVPAGNTFRVDLYINGAWVNGPNLTIPQFETWYEQTIPLSAFGLTGATKIIQGWRIYTVAQVQTGKGLWCYLGEIRAVAAP